MEINTKFGPFGTSEKLESTGLGAAPLTGREPYILTIGLDVIISQLRRRQRRGDSKARVPSEIRPLKFHEEVRIRAARKPAATQQGSPHLCGKKSASVWGIERDLWRHGPGWRRYLFRR